MHYPGTVVETVQYKAGASRQMFDGIFATGGITLSQVSVITGLETYLIQNWVKRGFVEAPEKKMYSSDQLARIIFINMLKDTLQIDKICSLIKVLQGPTADKADDLISDSELYHLYVDLLATSDITKVESEYTAGRIKEILGSFEERIPGSHKKLAKIFEIMFYAHQASVLRKNAEEAFAAL